MTVDPAVIPGLLLLLAELAALTAVGYVVVRVPLRQDDGLMALAQGMVVGPALWALIANFALFAVRGMAGAAVGWVVMLALGALLAWRGRERIRLDPRLLAGFVVVVLALFWVGLAGRQLLEVADWKIHMGLSAWIRHGGYPPELPWNPGVLVRYHHGIDLLIGLLAPPFGPDLAFSIEVLGVYAWMSFVLAVVTALVRRGSWGVALLLAPLILSYGLWTWQPWGPGILQGPVPAGLPAAGLRASLGEIYWPTLVWEEGANFPDIWKPSYTLAYALALVVLERAAHTGTRSWPGMLAVVGVVGFLGLLSTSVTPVVLVLWAGLEAVELVRAWRARTLVRRHLVRPGVGLALAAVVLLVSGGRFTGILDGTVSSGVVWRWDGSPGDWRVLGVFEAQPGGLGLLALGPVVVAGLAALLARRDRLVLALAVGAGVLALSWVALRYDPFPWDLNRLSGHARNLAMVAFLLALSARLAELRPRWRYAVGALLAGLVIWPTSAMQVRHVGMALEQGVEVANATLVQPTTDEKPTWGRERTAMPEVSAPIAAYIRDHSAVDARVLVPEFPYLAMSYATGRANSEGYTNVFHLIPDFGPEFADARDYLEPGAVRRLGFAYVYAPDAWVAGLPDRARDWLADPELFELVMRDSAVTLYRVRPAFPALEVAPTPASFEALRQAVPPGATMYWPDGEPFETDTTLRVISALSPEVRLYGVMRFMLRRTYALTSFPAERLGEQTPDLVILSSGLEPWALPPESRQPIWWNEEIAIYAPNGAVARVMPPPPEAEPPPIKVRASDVREANGQLAFTLTVDDHSPDGWTGQDWVLISVDGSPWGIPRHLEPDHRTPVAEQWFAGQMVRGRGVTTHGFIYDARVASLAVRTGDGGGYRNERSSGDGVGPGSWTLAVRLLREEDRGTYLAHEDAALIPVLKIVVAADGSVSYEVHESARDG